MTDKKRGGANRPLTEFEESVIKLNGEMKILIERVKGVNKRIDWLFTLVVSILLLIAGLYLKGS